MKVTNKLHTVLAVEFLRTLILITFQEKQKTLVFFKGRIVSLLIIGIRYFLRLVR